MKRLWLALAPVVLVAGFAAFRFADVEGSGAAHAASASAAAAVQPAPEAASPDSATERDAALLQATEGDWSLDEFRERAASGRPKSGADPPEVAPEASDVPEVTFFTPVQSPQGFDVAGSGDSQAQTFGSRFPTDEDDGPSTDTVVRGSPGVRAAFYYPWFPQAWSQDGVFPFTKYHPTLGYYDSSDRDVIRRHIEAMEYGNIDAGIASWWGPGHYTDAAFVALLEVARGTGFKWAVYYEAESVGDPTVGELLADLRYIEARYARDPSYLRVDGRWVVFVYSTSEDRCAMAERWKEAALATAFIVLKAFPNQRDCTAQPDAWHYYNPLVYTAGLAPDSYAISPGYAKPGDDSTVARELDRWRESVREMASATVRFQLVLTFNEWGEGTSVESADEWASPSGYGSYLDVLHEYP